MIKMVYKSDKKIMMLHPLNIRVKKGDIVEVSKESAESMLLLGFDYLDEDKHKKVKKKEGKQNG